jgi:hypothetical protein
MNSNALFCNLTSKDIAAIITSAKRLVCYAGPGIQVDVAEAMVVSVARLGTEMITVCVDFDERVMRMGYGEIKAVETLRKANVEVTNISGLRAALIIVDDSGFIFTPTPLYLESESFDSIAPNAVRMSQGQIAEALARLSPAAKVIAVAQAKTPEEKLRIAALPVDTKSVKVKDKLFSEIDKRLVEAPPVRFDLARQVRVFEPYLQYVELSLTGTSIQRHPLAIPPKIQKLGGSKDLEGRLRTTFDLIEKDSQFSSKALEDDLNAIRKNFTPSLGKDHGRVVLKAAKPHLVNRLIEFRVRLAAHQITVANELQGKLDTSRKQIVDYYLAAVIAKPPDALRGQLLSQEPSKDDALLWLNAELDSVFPAAADLIHEMKLDERYKDVTFETLNRGDFIDTIKAVFPKVNWDKAYKEFRAAGEC